VEEIPSVVAVAALCGVLQEVVSEEARRQVGEPFDFQKEGTGVVVVQ